MKPRKLVRSMVGVQDFSSENSASTGRPRLCVLQRQPIHAGVPGTGTLRKAANRADDGNQEVDAVVKMDFAEREAWHAGLGVDANGREADTDGRRNRCLGLVRRSDAAQCGKGEREQGEILRRAEQQRDLDQLRCQKDQAPGGQKRADKGRNARQRQGFTGSCRSWPWDSRRGRSSWPVHRRECSSRIEDIRPPYMAP